MKKLYSYLFLLLLIIPAVIAAPPPGGLSSSASSLSIQDRFEIFVEGFNGISLRGGGMDAGALVNGFIAILPVIGLVVIVFGLMFFVTKISIFKSPEHDKYARMIAFGVALIGLAQQSVYNTILGLSTTFLILVFILAVVFIFIMFTNHSRKAHLTSHAELHKITGNALGARRDLEKIKHELQHEKALYEKTNRDLEQLDADLNNISHLTGNELDQVDKLAKMLRKATAAYDSGNSPAVNQYVTALSKDLAGLITTMQHEQNVSGHLGKLVSQIEMLIAKWAHSSDKDKSEEEHLQKLFHKLSESWGLNVEEKELKELYKKEQGLIKHLKTMREHLHGLQSFYDRIMGDTEDLEKASYQRKHLEANAVRDNIMNRQFNEAHKHLDNLRAIIEYEPHVIKKFKNHEHELRSLVSKIHAEEDKLNQLIKGDVLKKLNELRADTKKKSDSTAKLAHSLASVVSQAIHDLGRYKSSAKTVLAEKDDFLHDNNKYDWDKHHSNSTKRSFDFPHVLLTHFRELEVSLSHLKDAISKDAKDGKLLKHHLSEAISILKTFERELRDIQTTLSSVNDENFPAYRNLLDHISHLVKSSKDDLFSGSDSLLTKLEKFNEK